jgi:hypothetical protein
VLSSILAQILTPSFPPELCQPWRCPHLLAHRVTLASLELPGLVLKSLSVTHSLREGNPAVLPLGKQRLLALDEVPLLELALGVVLFLRPVRVERSGG